MYRDFTLLTDGKEAFPEILNCIHRAHKSLEINMFIWRDDNIGNRIAQAVLDAADRGVSVFLSVDRYGVVLEKAEECKKSFFHKNLTLTERLKIRALELIYPMPGTPVNPPDPPSECYLRLLHHPNVTVSAHIFKADHSKYYIFDEEILIMGGINIEDKENGADLQGRVYQDYMVKMEGRVYVDGLRAKLERGEQLEKDWFFGVNTKAPYPRRFEMEDLYLDIIRSAREELSITMAYFSPLKPFIQAILDAHRRGVKVTILIPERANFQSDSNRKTVHTLLEQSGGGITVYLSPKMVHTKLVMNESILSFGSTNITKKAFGQLSELNLFVKNVDSPFRSALLSSMEENYCLSHRMAPGENVSYRPVLARLEGFFV